MRKLGMVLSLTGSLLLSMGCGGPAWSHPRHSEAITPLPATSAYTISLHDESGNELPTYQHRGRFYVMGDLSERYTITVDNPTGRRVEAVVSVDGLDVVDGRSASLSKRGYIINPYDTLLIEGFRTSDSNVAAFRFSSVGDSYAGLKGKARNVGVIGVAIFEEKNAAPVALPAPEPRRWHYDAPYGRGDVGSAESGSNSPRAEKSAPAPVSPSASSDAEMAQRPGKDDNTGAGSSRAGAYRPQAPSERPGLGTEFGESRYSQVMFTRFERKSQKPSAISEMRYNDYGGLVALGVLPARFDHDDLALRETADPFPQTRYAMPPR